MPDGKCKFLLRGREHQRESGDVPKRLTQLVNDQRVNSERPAVARFGLELKAMA